MQKFHKDRKKIVESKLASQKYFSFNNLACEIVREIKNVNKNPLHPLPTGSKNIIPNLFSMTLTAKTYPKDIIPTQKQIKKSVSLYRWYPL